MKYIITEQQLDKVYNSYLNFLFKGLYEVSSEKYPDRRFWKKGDKVVLELELFNYLFVLNKLWDNFENTFSLKHKETQHILKIWLEKNLGLKDIIPTYLHEDDYLIWQNI